MAFEISREWSSYHLIPQSVDVALNPPESYFFITDFLIIACGILYTLCYMFYTIRTYSDRYLAGTVQFLSATMAYEIYYAYVCTTTTFQRACFFVWFLFVQAGGEEKDRGEVAVAGTGLDGILVVGWHSVAG